MIARRVLLGAPILALTACSLKQQPKGNLIVPDHLTADPHGFYHDDEAIDGELFKVWAASQNNPDWAAVSHVSAVQRVVEGEAAYAYLHTALNAGGKDDGAQAAAIADAYTNWPGRFTDVVRIGVFDVKGKRLGRPVMVQPARNCPPPPRTPPR
ncbi:hypothetical protein ACFV9E_02230 [Streptomyces sp. NPDC059835]|uniref:hypothetical protein n=1 Tax=Streptomyces sp. NPDC059835 TaxID=3346967 RepID=UPI003669CBFB